MDVLRTQHAYRPHRAVEVAVDECERDASGLRMRDNGRRHHPTEEHERGRGKSERGTVAPEVSAVALDVTPWCVEGHDASECHVPEVHAKVGDRAHKLRRWTRLATRRYA